MVLESLRRSLGACVMLTFLAAIPASATSVTLYGVSSNVPGSNVLYNVNSTSGAATNPRPLVGLLNTNGDGLAFLNGTLYESDAIVGGGEEWLTEMSTADLKEYLRLSDQAVGEF